VGGPDVSRPTVSNRRRRRPPRTDGAAGDIPDIPQVGRFAVFHRSGKPDRPMVGRGGVMSPSLAGVQRTGRAPAKPGGRAENHARDEEERDGRSSPDSVPTCP
jgi:hypothetical protein